MVNVPKSSYAVTCEKVEHFTEFFGVGKHAYRFDKQYHVSFCGYIHKVLEVFDCLFYACIRTFSVNSYVRDSEIFSYLNTRSKFPCHLLLIFSGYIASRIYTREFNRSFVQLVRRSRTVIFVKRTAL